MGIMGGIFTSSPLGQAGGWKPRRLRPLHLRILRLYFQGMSGQEIVDALTDAASKVPLASLSLVYNVINSADAAEILGQFQGQTLDTIMDVQTDAQAIAPAAFEELVSLALNAKDERVRASGCKDILAIAGHQPVKRVIVRDERDPAVAKHDGKSEAELRAEMLEVVGMGKTVH